MMYVLIVNGSKNKRSGDRFSPGSSGVTETV